MQDNKNTELTIENNPDVQAQNTIDDDEKTIEIKEYAGYDIVKHNNIVSDHTK